MAITTSKLRANIDRVLDQVLETGVPVELEHRGRRLRIVAVEAESRVDSLEPHPGYLEADPEYIVHMDWSREWSGADDLALS
jgi:hypothetical protein